MTFPERPSGESDVLQLSGARRVGCCHYCAPPRQRESHLGWEKSGTAGVCDGCPRHRTEVVGSGERAGSTLSHRECEAERGRERSSEDDYFYDVVVRPRFFFSRSLVFLTIF